MEKKTIIDLIAIVAIALVVAFSGCVETPEVGTQEIPSEISIKSEGTVIDVMKQVPTGSVIGYTNLRNMREDEDLAGEAYPNFVGIMLSDVGIPEAAISIDKLAYCNGAYLIWGDFDLKKIRGYLKDESWQQDTYRDVEVWYREDGNVNEIALFKGEIIMGGKDCVKPIIRVMKGEYKSLYDNKDMLDVVNKLPDGFTITMGMPEAPFRFEGAGRMSGTSFFGEDYGVVPVCFGSSQKKISKDELKIDTIYKFNDERTAEDVANKMEQRYNGSEVDVEISTQDEYVTCISLYKNERYRS